MSISAVGYAKRGRQPDCGCHDYRFIPNRDGIDIKTSYQLLPDGPSTPTKGKRKANATETDAQKGESYSPASCSSVISNIETEPCPTPKEEANKTFNALLKTELFGPSSIDPTTIHNSPSSRSGGGSHGTNSYSTTNSSNSAAVSPASPSSKPLFSFSSPSRKRMMTGERERVVGGSKGLDSPTHERYSVSPVRYESQKLLLSPRKAPRLMSKVPFKVLDAPDLAVSSRSFLI